jgi:hypothetical protein
VNSLFIVNTWMDSYLESKESSVDGVGPTSLYSYTETQSHETQGSSSTEYSQYSYFGQKPPDNKEPLLPTSTPSPLARNPTSVSSKASSIKLTESEEKVHEIVREVLECHALELQKIVKDINLALPDANLSFEETMTVVHRALVKRLQPKDTSTIDKFVSILHSEEEHISGEEEEVKEGIQLSKMKKLNEQFEEFEEVAVRFSELIISERPLQSERKTIAESQIGGVAGGQKYIAK